MAQDTGFEAFPPPREVPLLVKARVLFGGPLSVAGWAFFGFGSIFVWMFGLNADYTSWYRFSGAVETAAGKITRSEATNFTSGGSRGRRGTPIYANRYAYREPDGVEHAGVSYATGVRLSAGEAVTVEHPAGRPEISRIRGMRRAPLPGCATT